MLGTAAGVPETRMPALDAVLVTYNSAGCLSWSLSALKSFMRGCDYRLIVVDNASEDETVATLRRLEPGATVVENRENVGFARAVNQAVGLGCGEYVLLVNPDIRQVNGSVAALLEPFADDDRVAAVATRMVDEAGRLQRTCHTLPSPFTMLSENLALHDRFPRWPLAGAYRMLDWAMDEPREVEDACGGFLVLRRTALADVGPLDERFFLYYEETDWLGRARARAWKTVFTPSVEVVHPAGNSSDEPREAMSVYLLQSQYKYVRKRFGGAAEAGLRCTFLLLDLVRSLGRLAPSAARRASAGEAWRRVSLHLGRKR